MKSDKDQDNDRDDDESNFLILYQITRVTEPRWPGRWYKEQSLLVGKSGGGPLEAPLARTCQHAARCSAWFLFATFSLLIVPSYLLISRSVRGIRWGLKTAWHRVMVFRDAFLTGRR